MELFRQIGMEAPVVDVAKTAWKMGGFGGARRGRTLVEAEALDLPGLAFMGTEDPSPCSFVACPQTLVEPVLLEHLQARGGDVRVGTELVAFREGEAGVRAVVRDREGHTSEIAAQYLIGVDGGRSFVRSHLGIATSGTPATQHLLNLYIHADLTEQVRGRTFSQCLVANESVRGLFLSKNNTTEWSFHLDYDPAVSSPLTLPDDALVERVRAAIGVADVPIDLVAKTTWSTAVRVADRYRVGRVFLAGDAAHVMPPWGGFNANTGIADVHNLAWRIAASESLDSYEIERHPVAVRNGQQAVLRTDFDARFGLETAANRDVLARLQTTGALLTRYKYPADEPVAKLSAQVGTRFPHAWIMHDGKRISTLDLFGKTSVSLSGNDLTFAPGLAPGESANWQALTGLPDNAYVLVRPDGFVAARSR